MQRCMQTKYRPANKRNFRGTTFARDTFVSAAGTRWPQKFRAAERRLTVQPICIEFAHFQAETAHFLPRPYPDSPRETDPRVRLHARGPQVGHRRCLERSRFVLRARSAPRKILAEGTPLWTHLFRGWGQPPRHTCFAGTDETSFVGEPVFCTAV